MNRLYWLFPFAMVLLLTVEYLAKRQVNTENTRPVRVQAASSAVFLPFIQTMEQRYPSHPVRPSRPLGPEP